MLLKSENTRIRWNGQSNIYNWLKVLIHLGENLVINYSEHI